MTKLEFLNKFFFQWFFIRLAKVSDKKTNKIIRYKILKWIIPLTGWKNDYKYIWKNK